MGSNNDSPSAGYLITHDGGTKAGTFDLSRFNSGITDQWRLLETDVLFAAGTGGSIRITNNNTASNDSGLRFNMDAVKLVFTQAVPVSLSDYSVE